MILSLGDCEYAIPLASDFPPSASAINQTIPTRTQISHARKLARAKRYLWRRGLLRSFNWKGEA